MDLVRLPASEMARLVRERKISPVELIEAHFDQIDALNPTLNAFIELRREQALSEAHLAEQAVYRNREAGPLHGVPISIKSSIAVEGLRWECGSRLRQGLIAEGDAPLVQRLKAAGAIILGSTNVPELLMAYETGNSLYGRTNSAWELSRTSGGSSGGEAAAISACMSAAGVGSDGGGSVRVPAHHSGICGLKPTPGRIPATGHYPESLGPFALLGVVGPMARTAEDLEILFRAMAGPDDGDTSSAPVALSQAFPSDLKGLTIGYFEEDELCPVTAETRRAVAFAAEALRRRGFRVAPYTPSVLREAREYWWTLFVRLGAEVIRPMFNGREDDISAILSDFLSIAAADLPLTKEMLLAAWFGRDRLRLQLAREMQDTPVLLSPVCAIPAFRHSEREWLVEGKRVDYLRAMSYTQCFNLLGNPAAVAPVARSPEGLPIGVQIVGRPYAEELVLGIAREIDQEFGYRPPPLLSADRQLLAEHAG